ncbi:TIGR03619 family F420-dependent LLM class oxidoreductase [Nocardia vaccinii]|uniref:TIGR03619 family F420-dependent LLM class oxidoreductase n=1 Tax=Nocardia vaccinii TaxID=1822 RepID=UPI00082A19C5|nr:TIGR03619 family F420-dependent LLM class oxidoreductase [Nocardia vaccinii]
MGRVSIGVHLPHNQDHGKLAAMARLAEECGADSLWVPDHTLLVEDTQSRYPFSTDGRFFTPPDEDWFDWVATLGHLSAVTTRARLGVCVAVIAHRNPIVLAKQVATLDRLSGGRIELGVGIGWLREEFAALGVPFDRRGHRTDGALRLLTAAWSGSPPAGQYGPYSLPAGARTHPTPCEGRVPILVGGDSPGALRRIARLGAGWFGTAVDGRLSAETVRDVIRRMHDAAAASGRDPSELRAVVRIPAPAALVGTTTYTRYLRGLCAAGATELTFDVSWRDAARAEKTLRMLTAVKSEF